MFQPPIFREERVEILQQMIQAHPFATLITMQQGQIRNIMISSGMKEMI